jgi:N-acetylneuraminate synthase
MFIQNQIDNYIIYKERSIKYALDKIDLNKLGFLVVVNKQLKIQGILTDGDFRRWLINSKNTSLTQSIKNVSNKEFSYLSCNSSNKEIIAAFKNGINFLPLVDDSFKITAIAFKNKSNFKIDKFQINKNSSSFIIAEIGNNHNGKIDLAFDLVDKAIESGADCAKFQMRSENLYRNSTSSEDLGSEYTLDLLSKFQLKKEELFKVFDYCKKKGILPLCTPFDLESLMDLEEYGMTGYKVASADLTNHILLKELCKTQKPLICSTGMASNEEIIDTVSLLRQEGANFCLLHCNSTYPAPYKDINLNYLNSLKTIGKGCQIGYSGHERGYHIPIAAVSLGARIIEKHFTVDREMEGNDHKVSLLPEEFKEMVSSIRDLEKALGTHKPRLISQGEMMNREVLAKSLISNRKILKGDVILENDIEIKSPGNGLQPYYLNELIGKKANRNIKKNDFFYESDIKNKKYIPRNYNFNRPFGIPIRYHDFKNIVNQSNFDLVEFHFSYSDLKLNPCDFLDSNGYDMDFVIHSPELFENDHLMDLSNDDINYRERSIYELERVIKKTIELKRFFKKSKTPLIIINAGGWSVDSIKLSTEQKQIKYELIGNALNKINSKEVEIIIQTMPPYPWHFGGQRYHNLFLDADEIVKFCDTYDKRICLDVSHSKLYCNKTKKSFHEFLNKTCSYSAHFHIVDAAGLDSEGLQIDKGEIDFKNLGIIMDKLSPEISFIPEIWQGHKNNGIGFWEALEKLEKYFKI